MDIDKEDKEMAQHAGVTLNFKNLLIGLDEPSSEKFVVYRIQIRDSNKTTSILHLSERLFQQYLVDQYAKWESNQQNFMYKIYLRL
ncbi:unnamed protein product [Rhizophagus irregularis]|uniref:Uncharacterized protein n=1 Tax=Rhizophagus irregularis TaxID=588596 RepID=A0A915YPM2_9GLOM|nr:unnamed protein product [Rhizophagus irregularis]